MNQLDLYVGVDTGPTHIMGALHRPMVALYHGYSPSRLLAPLEHPSLYSSGSSAGRAGLQSRRVDGGDFGRSGLAARRRGAGAALHCRETMSTAPALSLIVPVYNVAPVPAALSAES
jgi:hypothetical protein